MIVTGVYSFYKEKYQKLTLGISFFTCCIAVLSFPEMNLLKFCLEFWFGKYPFYIEIVANDSYIISVSS